MLKAVAKQEDGRNLIVLGVTDTNLDRLKANDPIIIHGEDLGIEVDIFLFHGKETKDLKDILKSFIGRETELVIGSPTRAKMREEARRET